MSATLLADNLRKAAHGLHRCRLCGEKIAPREQYRDQRFADEGTVYTFRTHAACLDRMYAYLNTDEGQAWQDDGLPPWSSLLEWEAEAEQSS